MLQSAYDFSARRSDVFPAVEPEHFEVHSASGQTADVTEGTGTGIGTNWERCRYDWSKPGCVTATVTDSNVYAPGSSWEITAVPTPEGTRVEMSWVRRFKRTRRGLLFGTVFRVIGRRSSGSMRSRLSTTWRHSKQSCVPDAPRALTAARSDNLSITVRDPAIRDAGGKPIAIGQELDGGS